MDGYGLQLLLIEMALMSLDELGSDTIYEWNLCILGVSTVKTFVFLRPIRSSNFYGKAVVVSLRVHTVAAT